MGLRPLIDRLEDSTRAKVFFAWVGMLSLLTSLVGLVLLYYAARSYVRWRRDGAPEPSLLIGWGEFVTVALPVVMVLGVTGALG